MPEIYEDDELATFFASLKTLEDRVFFELLLQTGSREQEAMYLEWSDIKQARTLHLHSKPKYAFKMKDHEERELPLPRELYDLLLQLREKHPNAKLVFETTNSKPDTKLLLLVKRRVRRAGLNCGLCAGCIARGECERWFLHKFRATYCTKLLRAGMDLRTAADTRSRKKPPQPTKADELLFTSLPLKTRT
jgi:integrase